MSPWYRGLLVMGRLRIWLAVLRAHKRGERIFLEWDGQQWSVIED
jgi:hypothetical protein